ncbi:MAG: glycosyltransferase family 4 protein [Candidatus Buchananbacteria bacterium]|nr:glycosyltransferase family 4 protein [Candidatus Buchananbacteria bacterium]
MKLLMITRKIDSRDALAGFAWNWVKKIGENTSKLYVISWQAGDASGLAKNIEVIFLPKSGRIKKVFTLWSRLIKVLPKVDGLFCHMNPEYTILSAPLAKIYGKKVVSWYTHKQVNWRRRLMELLADKIITASASSFRRPWFSKKVLAVGHGIDTNLFKEIENKNKPADFKIISVGRISPTKDYESIIKALDILKDKNIKLKIIGDVILEFQRQYLASLRQMVKAMSLDDQVEFIGWIANQDMPVYYQGADLFINMSGTGSVDKVVLEAMSCGCLVLTSNEAFEEILPSDFMVAKNNPYQLAEKIKWLKDLSDDKKIKIRKQLREEVVKNHNLDELAVKIINQFK